MEYPNQKDVPIQWCATRLAASARAEPGRSQEPLLDTRLAACEDVSRQLGLPGPLGWAWGSPKGFLAAVPTVKSWITFE